MPSTVLCPILNMIVIDSHRRVLRGICMGGGGGGKICPSLV